jgi:hypothetical protein
MVILTENNQIVIKASNARKLLKMGFKIVDVKPQKQEDGTIDFTRCVFVFEGKEGLNKAIKTLI